MPNLSELKPLLIKHLVEVEENYRDFLNQLFPQPDPKRYDLETLFVDYIRWLEQAVVNLNQPGASSEALPGVVIGCTVELEGISRPGNKTLRLIHPYSSINQPNEVSFISKVGRGLLMKSVGQEVVFEETLGTAVYRLVSIQPDFRELGAPFFCPG